MAGLLGDNWDDPRTLATLQMAAGLLGGGNFGQAAGRGLADYQRAMTVAREQERRQQELAMREAEQKQQMQVRAMQMQAAQQEAARKQGVEGAYRDAFESPATQALAGGQGPTPGAAQTMQGMQPRINQERLIQGLMQHDPLAAAQMLQPKPKKLSKLEPMRGPDGKMVNVAVYEDGTTSVLPYGVRPDISLQNLGNRVAAIDKNDTSGGQSFAVGMTPEGRDSSARGWAGVRQADARLGLDGQRLALDREQGIAKAGVPAQAKVTDANEVLAILGQAKTLLPGSTSSYVGAGVDEAARAFGYGTKGAQSAAQLKALEGALISKMPKMTGPQSDKDVMLYKQMAGQIGDNTLPVSTRQAAIKAIEKLNRRYAGLPEEQEASAGSYGDAEKERRYQEFKRSQGR